MPEFLSKFLSLLVTRISVAQVQGATSADYCACVQGTFLFEDRCKVGAGGPQEFGPWRFHHLWRRNKSMAMANVCITLWLLKMEFHGIADEIWWIIYVFLVGGNWCLDLFSYSNLPLIGVDVEQPWKLVSKTDHGFMVDRPVIYGRWNMIGEEYMGDIWVVLYARRRSNVYMLYVMSCYVMSCYVMSCYVM